MFVYVICLTRSVIQIQNGHIFPYFVNCFRNVFPSLVLEPVLLVSKSCHEFMSAMNVFEFVVYMLRMNWIRDHGRMQVRTYCSCSLFEIFIQ